MPMSIEARPGRPCPIARPPSSRGCRCGATGAAGVQAARSNAVARRSMKDGGLRTTGFAMGARASGRSIGCAPTQRRRADAGAKINRRAPVRHDQGLDRVLPFPDQAVSRGGHGNGVERAGLQHQENDLLGGHAGVDGCDPKVIAGKSAISSPIMAPFEPEKALKTGVRRNWF